MNISPELAAKVLDADLRNIVKKVSDGGILAPGERQMLQNAAFPDSAAKAKRALALALRYSTGARLTAPELAEVREMHPGFAPDAVPVTPPTPMPEENATPPAPAGPSLVLTPAPSPAAGDGSITRAQLDAWGALYGVKHRQLRRWIERGEEKSDPCPLDEPMRMPLWIDKNIEKVRGEMREKVQAAANAAARLVSPPSPVPAASDKAVEGCPPPPPTIPVVPTMMAPLDLATVGGVEGESVDTFRQLFAATKKQLVDAYGKGDDDRINSLTRRLEKTGESLRKHEVQAEARARRAGELLSRPEVITEVAALVNMMRLMREQRVKRVASQMTDLTPDQLARLDRALNEVGEREEDILRNARLVKGPEDVELGLAA